MYVIAWIGLICSAIKDIGTLERVFVEGKISDRICNFIVFILYALIVYFFIDYLFLT